MLEYKHWKHGILDDRLTHHGVSFITYISQLCHCTVTSLTLRKSHYCPITTLHWRHNGRNSVSNHQHRYSLYNRLFRRRSKETSKFRVTGLCAGNSPGTAEFPAQMASNAEMFPFDNVIISGASLKSKGNVSNKCTRTYNTTTKISVVGLLFSCICATQ